MTYPMRQPVMQWLFEKPPSVMVRSFMPGSVAIDVWTPLKTNDS